ncbi:MAG: hypothetical protein NT047_01275 [Deltaproteobacteria bacterium]|nr:hypothetical protein [Deltaproteobacteria bacterium]
MTTGYGTKLIDLIERSPNEIAKQWCRDVKMNSRTPAFHGLADDLLIPIATEFYGNFREMFVTDHPFEAARKIFSKYAEERYEQGIPVQEAMYALVLMRRHIWLYAEFQAIFVSAVEHQQAAESLNRTILMFDYAIYVITEKYQFLIQSGIRKKVGGMLIQGGQTHAYHHLTLAALLIGVGALTFFSSTAMETVAMHLFYIPIVLAGLWFRSGGVLVAVALAVLLLLGHTIFLMHEPFINDLIRAVMFVFVGTVVTKLKKGLIEMGSILRLRERSKVG